VHKLLNRVRDYRWVLLSTAALFATSLIIFPSSFSPKYFDPSAFPHILFLVLVSVVLALVLYAKNGFAKVSAFLTLAIIFLIISVALSIGFSGNYFSALTGDTQRFTGAISLFSFLIVLIYHTNIGIEKAKSLLALFLLPIFTVTFLGTLQIWNIITLPGAGGAGSTLGNIDFLSAWTGTTLPLYLFFLTRKNWKVNIPILIALVLSIYVLIKLGVKQGLLDLILTLIFSAGYLLRRQISTLDLGKKLWYWIFGLAVFLWLELILLLPFQKASLPLVGNDANLKIRTEYWIAGVKTWFSHILFGVGPDNYGNYYQQYRTLNSVKIEELTTSNDAHSALFQTLATLGLLGSLTLLTIFVLLVIALIKNFKMHSDQHKLFYFLIFFLVVYSTNAMASPITLPHKYIFWAVIGLVIGIAQTKGELQGSSGENGSLETLESFVTLKIGASRLSLALKLLTGGIALVSIITISILSIAQFKLIPVINDLDGGPKSQRVLNYKHSNAFPCTYYYLTEQTIANQKSVDKVVAFAKAEIKVNPRCVDARLTLAKYYTATGQNGLAGWQLNELMKLAPANRDVLGIIGEVANRLGDKNLLGMLHDHEVKLGYLK
jgi:O-antigen ligase